MTDPELQALAEEARDCEPPFGPYSLTIEPTVVLALLARLARADAIEQAARSFLDLALCNAPDVPVPWGDPAVTGLVSALAALEAS